jgi:hypothetical protein
MQFFVVELRHSFVIRASSFFFGLNCGIALKQFGV